jgi:hypothetical protein
MVGYPRLADGSILYPHELGHQLASGAARFDPPLRLKCEWLGVAAPSSNLYYSLPASLACDRCRGDKPEQQSQVRTRQQETDAMIEYYALLNDSKRFDADQYLGL